MHRSIHPPWEAGKVHLPIQGSTRSPEKSREQPRPLGSTPEHWSSSPSVKGTAPSAAPQPSARLRTLGAHSLTGSAPSAERSEVLLSLQTTTQFRSLPEIRM